MKIIGSYIAGLKEALRQKKIVTLLFIITLLLSAVWAATFKSVMVTALEGRSNLYKLLNDFDSTIYSDFMNNYGDLVKAFITGMGWLSMFYFLFTVFFAGGVFRLMNQKLDKVNGKNFFVGCAQYFLRFLRLGLYTLLIQLIVFGVIAIIFSVATMNMTETSTEPTIFYTYLVWMILHIIFFIFITIVSDYAKIILVKEDSKKVWQALRSSFKFIIRRIHLVYSLYLLIIILLIILTILYLWLDSAIGMNSMIAVLVMMIIQQFLIWARMFIKVWLFGSQFNFYNEYYIARTQPMQTQEIFLNENL
ncbi:MAG: hypothetical protein NTZ27_09490 [Ignavibacteriales bacterium]|nr:hypothetical protein [Ignavibacteriales bacterium]